MNPERDNRLLEKVLEAGEKVTASATRTIGTFGEEQYEVAAVFMNDLRIAIKKAKKGRRG
jgi:hypothetical protein